MELTLCLMLQESDKLGVRRHTASIASPFKATLDCRPAGAGAVCCVPSRRAALIHALAQSSPVALQVVSATVQGAFGNWVRSYGRSDMTGPHKF